MLASYRASVCSTFGMFKRDASCWAREDLPALWQKNQSAFLIHGTVLRVQMSEPSSYKKMTSINKMVLHDGGYGCFTLDA